jgi:hypothetical protein
VGGGTAFFFAAAVSCWLHPLQADNESAPKAITAKAINDKLFMSILPKRLLASRDSVSPPAWTVKAHPPF